MQAELDVLVNKRGCLTVVPYTSGKTNILLRCHFVYKIKYKRGLINIAINLD